MWRLCTQMAMGSFASSRALSKRAQFAAHLDFTLRNRKRVGVNYRKNSAVRAIVLLRLRCNRPPGRITPYPLFSGLSLGGHLYPALANTVAQSYQHLAHKLFVKLILDANDELALPHAKHCLPSHAP